MAEPVEGSTCNGTPIGVAAGEMDGERLDGWSMDDTWPWREEVCEWPSTIEDMTP